MSSPRARALATPVCLTLPLALCLAACGGGAETDPGATEAELSVIGDNPGVGRERLAMEFGDLFDGEEGLGEEEQHVREKRGREHAQQVVRELRIQNDQHEREERS